MKNKKALIILTSATMAIAAFACVFGQQISSLASSAKEEYSCELPIGYSEIDAVIAEAIEAGDTPTANTLTFRGTVTRRNGDTVYVQRKSEAENYVYGIKVTGVNTYANTLAQGNIVDFSGGYVKFDLGEPTFILSKSDDAEIVWTTNPTGYNPETFYDFDELDAAVVNNPKYQASSMRRDFCYYSNKLITLHNIVVRNYLEERDVAGNIYNVAILDTPQLNSEFYCLSKTDFSEIALSAKNQANSLSITGYFQMIYFAENNFMMYLTFASLDDVVIGGSYLDTETIKTVSTSKYCLWVDSTQDIDARLPFAVYTVKGHNDVPYVEISDFYNNACALCLFNGYNLTKYNYDVDEHQYIYYNNYFQYYVNPEIDYIGLVDDPNYYAYTGEDSYTTYNDVTYEVMADGGEAEVCKVAFDRSQRLGESHLIGFDFSRYGLDIVEDNNHVVYAPLQALNIIFNDIVDGYCSLYNGKDLYWNNFIGQSECEYYSDSPWYNEVDPTYIVSEEYAEYNYACLCLSIEEVYGLAEYRGIDATADPDVAGADAKFTELGLKSRLLSTNSVTSEEALVEFVGKWFYDAHSGYTRISCKNVSASVDWNTEYTNALEENVYIDPIDGNDRYHQLDDLYNELKVARSSAKKDVGLSFYEDTAIITFDRFVKYSGNSKNIKDNLDDYTYSQLHSMGTDLLFRKAFNEIDTHEEINNVVFDLTMNGGGAADVIPFLEAYMTSDPSITCYNRLSGLTFDIHYNVDINYDGVFDENDTYQGTYSFYMLTSRYSFSCGNYFPTVTKEKGMATLFGARSGGGTCVVSALSTAYGACLRNSGAHQVGSWDSVNERFQNNELGIEVDWDGFPVSDYYNDEAIYNFIHSPH